MAHQPNLCLDHCIRPRFQPIHAVHTTTKIRREKQVEQHGTLKGVSQNRIGMNSVLFIASFVILLVI